MALHYPLNTWHSSSILCKESGFQVPISKQRFFPFSTRIGCFYHLMPRFSEQVLSTVTWISSCKRQNSKLKASKVTEEIACGGTDEGGKTYDPNAKVKRSIIDDSDNEDDDVKLKKERPRKDVNDPELMTEEERREWRRTIRHVLDKNPGVREEIDPIERKKKMEELLANYPLVVDEEDPDWPEDADGWGFNFNQFFNKITIKNVKKDDDDDDSYDSDKEVVWQDDNYIRPIKDITTEEWEETVFKDISPLVILVHNRYKRHQQNEKLKDELEKAVQIFWNSGLPSPRSVAVDAVIEDDLAYALDVKVFPELLFTKAGKILYREKVIRTADELSRIMAFFYYGAAQPPCLNENVRDHQEQIPSL